jgi:hypothetical protein
VHHEARSMRSLWVKRSLWGRACSPTASRTAISSTTTASSEDLISALRSFGSGDTLMALYRRQPPQLDHPQKVDVPRGRPRLLATSRCRNRTAGAVCRWSRMVGLSRRSTIQRQVHRDLPT